MKFLEVCQCLFRESDIGANALQLFHATLLLDYARPGAAYVLIHDLDALRQSPKTVCLVD